MLLTVEFQNKSLQLYVTQIMFHIKDKTRIGGCVIYPLPGELAEDPVNKSETGSDRSDRTYVPTYRVRSKQKIPE